jgi:hypothetical protein
MSPNLADYLQHMDAGPQLLEGDDIPVDTMPNLRRSVRRGGTESPSTTS